MKFSHGILIIWGCTLSMAISCSNDTLDPPGADPPCSNASGQGDRFVDCGNGTVTDTQTHLVWTKLADCHQSTTWLNAMDLASGLAEGGCSGELTDHSSAGDWRLPTVAEWQTLVAPSCSSPAIPDQSGTGCFRDGTRWAIHVNYDVPYWSSEPNVPGETAYAMDLNNGAVGSGSIQFSSHVWPVRSGH